MKTDAKKIAEFLSLELHGQNILINAPAELLSIGSNQIMFVNKKTDFNFSSLPEKNLLIIKDRLKIDVPCSFILSKNPRRDFVRVIRTFFIEENFHSIDDKVSIPTSCIISNNVHIGRNVVIEDGVKIGQGSYIGPNCYLGKGVSLGKNCMVKPGAVIGTSGFGFEKMEDDTPILFPHFGSVIIGNNVHIGANATIDSGTLSNTIIGDNVKIDNLVHIAHNCRVGKNSIIAASAELSGGVLVGDSVWISPNVSIKEKVRVGQKSMLGMGSTVINNIPSNTKVMGIGSLSIREYLSIRKILK